MSRNPLLLIVDDDAELRQGVQDALEEEGYATLAACDGQQALDILAAGSELPDAILLDLMMPRMNGWQFRQAQRGDPRIRDIPVLVITATRALQEDPIDIDGQRVLFKPFGLDDLIAKVRPLLAG